MTDKLEIFDILKQIDKRNITFFENLTIENKKQFVPLLTMRWFSSGSSLQAQLSNAILNPMVFKMYHHPNLMYKLMVACSDGKSKRYNWIKKKSKDKTSPTIVAAISEYYNCSKKDAIRYKCQLLADDILEIAEVLGYDKEQIKKIKTELK